jgi:hypothetical protein
MKPQQSFLPKDQQQLFNAVGPELKKMIGMIKPIYDYILETIKNGDLNKLKEQLASIKKALNTNEGKQLLQETISIIGPIRNDLFIEMQPLLEEKIGPVFNELITRQIASSGAVISAITQIILAPYVAIEEALNLFIMASSVLKTFGESLVIWQDFQLRWQNFVEKHSTAISYLTSSIEKLISFLKDSMNIVATSAKNTGKQIGTNLLNTVSPIPIPMPMPEKPVIGGRNRASQLEFLATNHLSSVTDNKKKKIKMNGGLKNKEEQIGGRIKTSRLEFLASNRLT